MSTKKGKEKEVTGAPYKSRNYKNIDFKYQLSAGALRTFENLKNRNMRSISSQQRNNDMQIGGRNLNDGYSLSK